jgi:hypothetical protein
MPLPPYSLAMGRTSGFTPAEILPDIASDLGVTVTSVVTLASGAAVGNHKSDVNTRGEVGVPHLSPATQLQ